MTLSDFETLEAAKNYDTVKGRMISPDMMVAFLAIFGIGRAVEIEDTEAAFAFRKALQFGSEFNLMRGHSASVEDLLEQMQSVTTEFKEHVIAYANPTIYPFANATLSQFNNAKGLYAFKVISFQEGSDICIKLNADLNEKVSATVWKTEQGFEPENAGRSVYLQLANKYRIDMNGKKSGEYEVRIPFANADFAVEVV